ncbi:MAG: fibronectin type III domain-containing protein [Actinomycetes bacterium]
MVGRSGRAIGVAVAAVLAVIASVLLAAAPAHAAGATYTVTSDMGCGATGSFEWAVAQANANPGRDTIEFTPGLLVDYNVCHRLHGMWYGVNATESVDIKGNGSFIDGQQMWANASGQVNPTTSCPANTAGSVQIAISPGFLDIGTLGANNTGVEVTIDKLLFDRLPTLVKVEKNAAFTMTDSSASRIQDFLENCNRAPILADTGADVTLRTFFFNEGSQPNGTIQEFNSSAVVEGFEGDLVLDHVIFDTNFGAYAVEWGTVGTGTVKIVSSRFFESGGFSFAGASSEIVNSAFETSSRAPSDRAVSFAGTATTTASTFVWRLPICYAAPPHYEMCQGGLPYAPDPSTSMGFGTRQTGKWVFNSTAIGAGADYPDGGPLLFNGSWPVIPSSTAFTSDAMTWVQDTVKQDNAAINAILPGARTGFPGLEPSADPSISAIEGITPLLGTIPTPGKLLNQVPTANCPGGANALINPIDGTSCITEDVLGSPRWSSTDNTRNIGAVQTMETPYLTVTGTGDQTVDLAWNRPKDPTGATVTGYTILYKIAGSADVPSVVIVSDPATLKKTITGLTNGIKYAFQVVARTTGEPSPPSNEVEATPFAPIGSPDPAASPGDSQVQLFWTVPATGGHPAPLSYFVMYRPKGTTQWITGPLWLSGRTTLIPELKNFTTYEFGVFARSTDGTTSMTGITTATPTGPGVAQVPLNGCVVSSGKMPTKGTKVVTRANCVTNAANRVATKVTCRGYTRGDIRYCSVIRKANGTVKVKTYGYRIHVKVVWSAPAVTGYNAYRQVKNF